MDSQAMKDATLATRTERAVAHLEVLLVRLEQVAGRLEYLLGLQAAVPDAPHAGEATPPFEPGEHSDSLTAD